MTRPPESLLTRIRREMARRSLIDFTLRTYPGYQAGWFHREVAARLDRFLADVIAQRSPRLMLFAPPRSGKTEIVSRRFPAYALGKYPDLSMIATSYASELASRNNRDVQRIIDDDEYAAIFPATRLWSANVRTTARGTWLRNSDIFEVVGRKGTYRSAGVMGGITGMGGNILLIDDPVKDAIESESKVYRDRLWDWYTSTLYTRRAPGAGILIILTRWHEDDLAGRLLAAAEKGEGERWEVVSYPAIAERDEEHRKIGEALHPERYSTKEMEITRLAVGARVWASLYQQRPAAAEGAIFKRADWGRFKWPGDFSMPAADVVRLLGIRRVVQSWDTAFKTKQESDFSSCVTFGEVADGWLILDVLKRKMQYPELKRAAIDGNAKWTPTAVLVEDKASGQSLVQELQRETRIPVVPVTVDVDKIARAHAVTPLHEAGRFKIPEGAPWAADFIDSAATFPNATHDDDVDAFTQGANYLARGGGAMGMFEWMRQQHDAMQAAKAERLAAAGVAEKPLPVVKTPPPGSFPVLLHSYAPSAVSAVEEVLRGLGAVGLVRVGDAYYVNPGAADPQFVKFAVMRQGYVRVA